MKLNFVLVIGLVCLVISTSARPADEYAEYEDEPAPPPPKKVPARSPLTGRRNPLTSSRNSKSSTTTTAAPAPVETEEDVAEEELPEELPEQASSTTETPKKFLKGGIVRPFRSNDELLAALKRRREQAAHNKHNAKLNQASEAEESAPAAVHSEATPKPARASSGRRRFNGSNKGNGEAAAEETSSTAAPARTGRRFNPRS